MQWVLEEQDPGSGAVRQRVTHPLRLVWLVSEPWTSPQVGAAPNRDAGDGVGGGRTGPGEQGRKLVSWNQVTHLFFILVWTFETSSTNSKQVRLPFSDHFFSIIVCSLRNAASLTAGCVHLRSDKLPAKLRADRRVGKDHFR